MVCLLISSLCPSTSLVPRLRSISLRSVLCASCFRLRSQTAHARTVRHTPASPNALSVSDVQIFVLLGGPLPKTICLSPPCDSRGQRMPLPLLRPHHSLLVPSDFSIAFQSVHIGETCAQHWVVLVFERVCLAYLSMVQSVLPSREHPGSS